jgi:hypothetical protein
MRRTQLGHAVKHGRKVTFYVFDADEVCGYIGGWDEGSWLVLVPTEQGIDKQLVSKHSTPLITLHDEATYEDEVRWEEMERIVAPFRRAVLQEVFGHTRPANGKAGKQDERLAVELHRGRVG